MCLVGLAKLDPLYGLRAPSYHYAAGEPFGTIHHHEHTLAAGPSAATTSAARRAKFAGTGGHRRSSGSKPFFRRCAPAGPLVSADPWDGLESTRLVTNARTSGCASATLSQAAAYRAFNSLCRHLSVDVLRRRGRLATAARRLDR